MQTPFDTALQFRDLSQAAEEYALSHGDPGTSEFRVAWTGFRRRIRTDDDLRRWRAARAGRTNERRERAAPARSASQRRSGAFGAGA